MSSRYTKTYGMLSNYSFIVACKMSHKLLHPMGSFVYEYFPQGKIVVQSLCDSLSSDI